MRNPLLRGLGTAALLASLGAAGAPPLLEPGNWMFTIHSTTNGRTDPPLTGEDCLNEQLQDLGAYFAPKLEGAEAKCETTRKPRGDLTMEYHLNCRGAGFTTAAATHITIRDSRHVTLRSEVETRTLQSTSRVVSVGDAMRTGACRRKK